MDINFVRSLLTAVVMAVFLGIVWWAYGPVRRERFERDALLPFTDDSLPPGGEGIGMREREERL